MGEIIYSFIQLCFIVVEIYLMVNMFKTKDNPNMDVPVNLYNILLVDTCLAYFIIRSLFG